MIVEIILKQIINPNTFAVIVITCFFLHITKKSWQEVVKRAVVKFSSRYLSIGTDKLEQRKVSDDKKIKQLKKVKQLYKSLNKSNETIKKLEKDKKTLFGLWKFYMFSYFNLYLVPNSKLSLL